MNSPIYSYTDRIYTDIYFIMDTTGTSFTNNDACLVEYALMQVLSGLQSRTDLINFRYAFIVNTPNLPPKEGDILFINTIEKDNNGCFYGQQLVDDQYILSGNPDQSGLSFLPVTRWGFFRYDVTLQALQTSLKENEAKTRRSVAVLVTGGIYLGNAESRGNILGSTLLKDLKAITNLQIITIGFTGATLSDGQQLIADIEGVASSAQNAFLLDRRMYGNTSAIVERILNRFEGIGILGTSDRPTG